MSSDGASGAISILCATCAGRICLGDEVCRNCGQPVDEAEKRALRRMDENRLRRGPDPAAPGPAPAAPTDLRDVRTDFGPAWAAFAEAGARRRKRTALMIIGVALFALSTAGQLDPAAVVILLGVLVVHELGHVAAMWVLGYRDLAVFFLPFFGAVATGRTRHPQAWRAAVVTLAGPLPGLLLGWAIVHGWPALVLQHRDVRVAVSVVLVINGLNLLPFMPLDGGRLLNLTIFSRHPTAEALFTATAGMALAVLAFWRGWWVMALAGLATVLFFSVRRRLLRAGHDLRGKLAGVGDPDALTQVQRETLYDAAATVYAARFSGAPRIAPERRSALLAAYMRLIFDRATLKPVPGAAAVVLTLAYVGAWALLWPLLGGFLIR
jgi:Zn-dependent protease